MSQTRLTLAQAKDLLADCLLDLEAARAHGAERWALSPAKRADSLRAAIQRLADVEEARCPAR